MTGIRHARIVLLVAAALTVLAVPAAAAGSHGGGGGGGGGGTTTTAAPAVALSPTSLTFGAQAIGTTSAPQSITVANTGNAGLFIASAAVRNTLEFTEVSDGCSGLTLAPGTSCSVSITFSPTGTGTRSVTVTDPPPPTPSGCQTGGTLKESLSGSAFNGKTPSGQATADETKFSGCGGFSLLSVQVKDVNLPDGSVLWGTLDFMPVGTITLKGSSGTMPTYNMGFFGVSNDDVRVYSALHDVATSQQILIGPFFK